MWTGMENLVMAEVIFGSIKDYSFMHSSHQIKEAVTKATMMSLPRIKEYLESRLIKPEYSFLSSTQQAIKTNKIKKNPSMGEYGVISTQIWTSESQTKKKLFDDRGPLQPMNLKYLDLPYIYKRTSEGRKFIEALTQCEDLEIFGLKSI
jgi:hypothetical protein